MTLEYRKATIDDIEALTRIRATMLCDGTDCDDRFRAELCDNTKAYIAGGFGDKSFAAWVAAHDGEIVAMGWLSYYFLPPTRWCPGGKTAYLSGMYTLPAYRGKGAATRLLSLLIEEGKGNGCERVLLDSTDMGRPLYEKYGFETSDTAMMYFPFGIVHK